MASKTVVLAYSGGLDTSVAVKWLAERGNRVVAFMADIGQGGSSRALIARARGAGAWRVVVRDLRREFLREYVWPALQAHAVYEGTYLLATALSRPLIAKHLVRVAHETGAGAVAHGCTGKGNDQVRFELTVRMLDPGLGIVAPVREWEFRSREDEIDYARRHRIPVDVTKRSPYSIDRNLWGLSIEAGVLEDPWAAPPADTYLSIRPPARAAARPGTVRIDFSRGLPVAVDGRREDPLRLVARLAALGAKHGIGRSDMIESRIVGIKSREVYEAPAATILLAAHAELERLVHDRELLQVKARLADTYAQLVYAGLWETPLRKAIDAFVAHTQQRVNGSVRLMLHRGGCLPTGRRSPQALYRTRLATYTSEDAFDQRWAEGFIKIFGLPFEGSARGSRPAGH
ncbi:MAG TPA: argininosuccinate synthase [bacterium]